MRINTNMAALNAWRSAETNQNNLQKSLSRLSSGYRINTAADDAAGLAVSEKLTAQIRGISMATRNAQDASSLVQTAEGGAGSIQDMLQRMRELAVQASSDTLQDTDRAQLQEEFSALQSEIDRTAGSVTFNGRKLINGQSGDLATVTAGNEVSVVTSGALKAAGSFTVDVTAMAKSQVQQDKSNTKTAATGVTWNTTDQMDKLFGGDGTGTVIKNADSITFTQDGKSLTLAGSSFNTQTVSTFVQLFNDAASAAGMSARMSYEGSSKVANDSGATGVGLVINANEVGTAHNVTALQSFSTANVTMAFGSGADTVASADAAATIKNAADGSSLVAGTDYTVSGNTITGVSTKLLQGVVMTALASTGTAATVELSQNGLTFQVGANANETISASLGNLTSTNLKVDTSTLSIGDKTHATSAISGLDTALSTVSTERAKMGAMQNRLDNAVSSLQTQNENITAANSRIRDVDMAAEMANFTKYQVLSQASTAMLAQANQLSQGILTLLR